MLQNSFIIDEFENFFHQKEQPGLGGFRDPAKHLGPGRKIRKSGILDQDRDSDSQDEGFRDSTLGDCPGD